MAGLNGLECLDYLGFDGGSGRSYHDFRTTDHHLGTNTNDRHHESHRSKQPPNKARLFMVCYFRYRERTANWQPFGHRIDTFSRTHQVLKTQPPNILCRYGSNRNKHDSDYRIEYCYPINMCFCTHCAKLFNQSYSSGQIHAIRISRITKRNTFFILQELF